MAVKKTKLGYQLRWYDADGQERKRTYKGISRLEAEKLHRETLAQRDRGDRLPDERRAPTFATFAARWLEEAVGPGSRLLAGNTSNSFGRICCRRSATCASQRSPSPGRFGSSATCKSVGSRPAGLT